MPSHSSSNSRPWATLQALQERRKVVELLEATGFPAFLETLEEEARKPVPPTLNNWPVLRAWADGAHDNALKLKDFWCKTSIDNAIRDHIEHNRRVSEMRPVGENNPWPKD